MKGLCSEQLFRNRPQSKNTLVVFGTSAGAARAWVYEPSGPILVRAIECSMNGNIEGCELSSVTRDPFLYPWQY